MLESLFLIKLQTCNFIKTETLAQAFSCEFCKIFKNTFFTEHLQTTASLEGPVKYLWWNFLRKLLTKLGVVIIFVIKAMEDTLSIVLDEVTEGYANCLVLYNLPDLSDDSQIFQS